MQAAYGLDATDGVLQKTRTASMFPSGSSSGPCCSARDSWRAPGRHRDPRYLIEVIVNERVTTLHFVPPMLQRFWNTLNAPRVAVCDA